MKTIITGFWGYLWILRIVPHIDNIANGIILCVDRSVKTSLTGDPAYMLGSRETKNKMLNTVIKTSASLQKSDLKVKEVIRNIKTSAPNEWSVLIEFFDDLEVEYLTIDEFVEKYPNDTIHQQNDRNLIIPFIGPRIYKDTERVFAVGNKRTSSSNEDKVEDIEDEDTALESTSDDEYNDFDYYENESFYNGSPDQDPFDDPLDMDMDEDDEERWHHSSQDSDLD